MPMIDWLEFVIPERWELGGQILKVDRAGEVEWSSTTWESVQGEVGGSLAARDHADGVQLRGSPAKFLQGHNVFGPADAPALARGVAERAARALGVGLSAQSERCLRSGEIELFRVDVTDGYATRERSRCLEWIRAAERTGYLQHRGKGLLRGSTVVWGQGSRYWSLKAYSKGEELAAKGKGLPPDLPERARLVEFADDLLRVELQLRRRTLVAEGLHLLRHWNEARAAQVFQTFRRKLSLSGEYAMTNQTIACLGRAARMTYETWNSGVDVRAILSKATFYRHRRELLKVGVDIGAEPPNERNNVVPLLRIIEATPVTPPSWAHDAGLLWRPDTGTPSACRTVVPLRRGAG